MYIEEIVIDGFKSYSTRVGVGPFDPQFNAITGLNGSGKSNILDSICFVLGITNLSQVRVGNLSELVYKQGQAGVTKASVTIVFNNSDKSASPVGYENHDKIVITRQIVIGGRNRYLLNSLNVQQNQIQNLFHSVQLNVNNPHFLIMQGRITKVINMKPPEILSMIEEAAGTRMYENKKIAAQRTMEKKQTKVDEINRILAEEITPTLEKLAKERTSYMRWASNNNEIERLSRFCLAYQYVNWQSKFDARNNELEELEQRHDALVQETKELNQRQTEIEKEVKRKVSEKGKQGGKGLEKEEEALATVAKAVAMAEAKHENALRALKADGSQHEEIMKQIEETQNTLAEKEKVYTKEKERFDTKMSTVLALEKDIDRSQRAVQALSAGMAEPQEKDDEAPAQSLREKLLATQTKLSETEVEEKQKALAIEHLRAHVGPAQKGLAKTDDEWKKLAQEKTQMEQAVASTRKKMERVKFDPEQHKALEKKYRDGEVALQQLRDRMDELKGQLARFDFHYADPEPGFDHNKVKGVVAKLFHVRPEAKDYTTALEVCLGGRAYYVVVDNEKTGKKLLEHGQLRRRVTIIPLNKIVDPSMKPKVFQTAKEVGEQIGGQVYSALEIVGYEKEMEAAMKYCFGSFLVCDTPETAKKVTFHPDVRVRSVTKDGDLYDPAGTITGGSAPQTGNALSRLNQLAELEDKEREQKASLNQLNDALERSRQTSVQYEELEAALKLRQHELELLQERVGRSAYHTAQEELKQMKETLVNYERDLTEIPERKKELAREIKSLEKEIKSFNSSREERGKFLEKHIADLKERAKKKRAAMKTETEAIEQKTVELEALREQLKAAEKAAEASHQGFAGAEADVGKLLQILQSKQEQHAQKQAQVEALKGDMLKTDEALQNLNTELQQIAKKKEDNDLESKKNAHKIAQFHKDHKEAKVVVEKMEKDHPWIPKEKAFFGRTGTDFDFEKMDYKSSKERLDRISDEQRTLGKNVNKRVMSMFEKADTEYKDLLKKRDIIMSDKKKIEEVLEDLDQKKLEAVRTTWVKVNKDFGSIFSTLLPGANSKLEPPEGWTETEGLEIKVAFGDVWKQSLSELSGGQRSLLALSLVLALLLYKPAPMYILDEIDAALDLSHTQNIGHMIRTHFPHSQFVVVSLKEGMFNNANVLFRTRFVDGTSMVTRYGIRDSKSKASLPQAVGTAPSPLAERDANAGENPQDPGTGKRRLKRKNQDAEEEENDPENVAPAVA